jgi:hypothetical protein
MTFTIGELKSLLNDLNLPDSTLIVALDHYGEGIPYDSYAVRKSYKPVKVRLGFDKFGSYKTSEPQTVLIIYAIDIGPEPD